MSRLSASALAFIILTSSRNDEGLGAHWDELDLKARLWTAPTSRMKGIVEALGTSSTDFVMTELDRLINAVGGGEGGQAGVNAALAVIDGLRPKNEVEAMLASQMALTHQLAMEVLGRARRVKDIEQFDSTANAASKLPRTYVLQMEALANIRRRGSWWRMTHLVQRQARTAARGRAPGHLPLVAHYFGRRASAVACAM